MELDKTKTIVIGLDGAGFELLDPWIKQNTLPNLKKVKENGAYADMQSQFPPVTSPNWKCFSTGMNPGKFGIFWWENIDICNKRVYYPNKRTTINKELWDFIPGKKAVLNMPTTYPLKDIEGFIIAGPPDGPDIEYYKGKKIYDFINQFNYKVRTGKEKYLRDSSINKKNEAVDSIIEMIDKKFELAKFLLRKYKLDFLHLAIFYINVLHHFFWNDVQTKKGWILIDKKIGEMIDEFEEEYTFFFLSDHGSNKIEKVFNINTWLEEKGYLKTDFRSSRILNDFGINKQNILRILRLVLNENKIKKMSEYMPTDFILKIPNKDVTFKKEAKGKNINWEKSKILASGQGPVYIIDKKNKKNIQKDLLSDFDELIQDGIINNVYGKNQIYKGKFLSEAPDILVDQGINVHINGDIGRKNIISKPSTWKGENKKTGIFLAYGKDIKKGYEIDSFNIIDITPTILHFYGLNIPANIDGIVKKEIFKEKSKAEQRKIGYENRSEKEKIKNTITKITI